MEPLALVSELCYVHMGVIVTNVTPGFWIWRESTQDWEWIQMQPPSATVEHGK